MTDGKAQPFDEGPILFTPRLVLRPLTSSEADVQNMFWMLSNPEIRKFIRPGASKQTIEETREQVGSRSSPPAFNFAVHLRIEAADEINAKSHAGPFIGAFGTSRHVPEVGYGMHPDYQGRGLALEALLAYERAYWAFVPSPGAATISNAPFVDQGGAPQPAQLSLMAREILSGRSADYIEAFTFKGNVGSCRMLEKAGYTMIEERDSLIPDIALVAPGTELKDCRFAKPRPGIEIADLSINTVEPA